MSLPSKTRPKGLAVVSSSEIAPPWLLRKDSGHCGRRQPGHDVQSEVPEKGGQFQELSGFSGDLSTEAIYIIGIIGTNFAGV